ncbi:hypothetical protein F9K33_03275 [bacterium]|nr:MAG: hypothetical protein F9K33_03275 [bacterium]
MIITTDGEILITGSKNRPLGDSLVDDDIVLTKLTDDGELVWCNKYETIGYYGYGQSLLETSDGYVVLAYSSDDTSDETNMMLIKTDKKGKTLWSKTCYTPADERVQAVVPTQDGGFLIAGRVVTKGIYLAKANSMGDTLWTKILASSNEYTVFSMRTIPDNHFAITGTTNRNGYNQIYVLKIDGAGNQLEFRTYGESGHSTHSYDLAISDGSVLFGSKDDYPYVVKTTFDGDTVWSKQILDISNQGIGGAVVVNSENDIFIVGSNWVDGNERSYFIKLSSSGELIWSRVFTDSAGYNMRASRLKPFGDGFLIGGTRLGSDLQCFLIRTDSEGEEF